MEYIFKCDDMDGLVLIDEYYLDKFNEEILYSFDIFLDPYGKSELVYDFPDEEWKNVYNRESKKFLEFCNSGKMIVFLVDKNEYNGDIQFSSELFATNTFLDIKSGKLILVNAGELIQCVSYPDLEMEKVLEIDNVEVGTYAVTNNDICNIVCRKSIVTEKEFRNVIEL